jgi:cytochrome c oxidase assembly protein subunit 15
MRLLATISLLFVIALVSVSAYLRLDNSGIGCADWPACYGLIGEPAAEAPTVGSTYERIVVEAQMAILSVLKRRDQLLSFTLLGLTVFLAWLGIYSGGLHSPAVVMGNLGGGFAMLGLLGWMVFRDARPRQTVPTTVRGWAIAALLLLCMQIGLGGLTSANFAASACQTVPDCHGSWLPGDDLSTAFDLTRQHEIGPTGMALGGPERADIHKLHRIVAVLATLTVLIAGLLALRDGFGVAAVVVMLLVIAEFTVGVAAILTKLPIGIAVAHNWLAAILLLSLLRLLAACNDRQAPV